MKYQSIMSKKSAKILHNVNSINYIKITFNIINNLIVFKLHLFLFLYKININYGNYITFIIILKV